ncbi:MAG: glutamine-hydrolyzing carbamoyl-phosphate synthase small subunit [Candidatus Levybacteria bacterium]|nr:glutamine-hydrolyzing carbamoyl-phosphate synthase small subunit [Candidatus Levybacteria bacterium]
MNKLVLKNGLSFEGKSFGADTSAAGEVVFSTGMMGYPESLTDPSYKGQILILTYPLVGNYGIPDKKFWEADKIMISGLIVSTYIDTPFHFQSRKTLGEWLKEEGIPALEIKDTRFLTQTIREKGTVLGKIVNGKDTDFYNPDNENLVQLVSTNKITVSEVSKSAKNILLIDCGTKRNIQRVLSERNVNVITVPWNFDLTNSEYKNKIDGVVISNGPGNPKYVTETVENIKKLFKTNLPILGVCLGNQLLSLAAGGDTGKLKYGHRSQNQPCTMVGSDRCYITTQNHGFEVSRIPKDFKPWFINANDGSNEGIIHKTRPIMSVQFHPEATPGPEDTEWIFDYFLEKL